MIPIERRSGAYRYRATFDVPKLAADGVLTHIDGRIGRRYSPTAARAQLRLGPLHRPACSAPTATSSSPTATIIDGALEKPCTPVPLLPLARPAFLYLPARAASSTG